MSNAHRNIGHWLLFLLAIIFGFEFVIFFIAAFQRGLEPDGFRFLMLTIVSFVTVAAALLAFFRRAVHPFLIFLGLLLCQPVFSSIANVLAQRDAGFGLPVVAAVAGVVLFVLAFRPIDTNRA
jgi:hypothetical protein